MPNKKLTADSYVIFIPGYYGSFLKRKDTNNRVWITLSQALWGSQTLALNNNNINVPGYQEMQVDGVMNKINVVPGLYNMNIYSHAIKGLKERLQGHYQVIPFAYDWRKDIADSSKKLNEFVESLYDQGAKKISIVAHSMGGMLASYYLIYGDQDILTAKANFIGAKKIDKLVMLGTPFRGTMHVFRNMQMGLKTLFNDDALEAYAVSSFPSSYMLIPTHNKALINMDGIDRSQFLFDVKAWSKYSWGLLSNKNNISDQVLENRIEFTKNMLNRAEHFYSLIQNFQTNRKAKTKIKIYIGNSDNMIHRAIFTDNSKLLFPNKNLEDNARGYDKAKLLTPGDGSVTVYSAKAPQSFYQSFSSVEVKQAPNSHLELINNDLNLDEISNFLMQ